MSNPKIKNINPNTLSISQIQLSDGIGEFDITATINRINSNEMTIPTRRIISFVFIKYSP